MIIDNWLMNFAENQRNKPTTISAMKSFSYLQALQALVMGVAFIGPSKPFASVMNADRALWYALTYKNLEVWDIVFLLGAIFLLISTARLQRLKVAHAVMTLIWFVFGAIWVYAGIITDQSYLFGLGLLSVFIGAQHAVFIRALETEGVE